MTRAVFMGTPAAALPILGALDEIADIELVVTRPDRPRGRSGRSVPPPVKVAALERDLEVSQPSTAAELHAAVAAIVPDVALVAAYGRLIRPELLVVPRHGFVNVHFSLLPRWRGASPVARAILAGDAITGTSLMVMDEGLDTGPVIESREVAIGADDTTGSLTGRLAEVGADLTRDVLPGFVRGERAAVPQDDALATAAGKIETDEAFIDPRSHSAIAVERAIRAFDPKPGAWGVVDGERIKLWGARPGPLEGPEPGTAALSGGDVLLGARGGTVRLLEVQPAGKPVMDARSWMNGRRGEPARFTR